MQKCEKFTEMVAEHKRGLRKIMWVSDGSQLQKAQHQLSVTHFSIQSQEDFQLAFISCILHQNGKSTWRIGLQQQGNYLLLYKTNDSRRLLLLEEYSYFGTAIFIPPNPKSYSSWRMKKVIGKSFDTFAKLRFRIQGKVDHSMDSMYMTPEVAPHPQFSSQLWNAVAAASMWKVKIPALFVRSCILIWESQPNATAQSDTRNQWAADWKPWQPNSRSAPFITTWTLRLPQSFCKAESGMHSSTFAHFTLVWALWRMYDTNLCSFHAGLGQSSNLFLSNSATKNVSSLRLPSYY